MLNKFRQALYVEMSFKQAQAAYIVNDVPAITNR